MAYNTPKVWLGFEDEFISDKHKSSVSFTTNKIGGRPDWPPNVDVENPKCNVCQLPRPLVLQIYAPLDNSPYHRTLYLFACVNPNCWNQSESWTCIRMQLLEEKTESLDPLNLQTRTSINQEWCHGADDWDDNNANFNEENGNLLSNTERTSDDDESCSFEDSLRMEFANISVDDRNANMGLAAEAQGGAVGHLHSPRATAEIEEGNEGEVISIDTPTLPQHNLAALLQEAAPLPQDLCHNKTTPSNLHKHSVLEFVSYFVSVGEEMDGPSHTIDRHVKELLLEYQQKQETANEGCDVEACGGAGEEGYEKSAPTHGDKMFHYFLTRIKRNPGQILRYSRGNASPLLLYPINETHRRCEYCNGEMVFEFQVLPTLISKLRLTCDVKDNARLEFGTVLIFTCQKSCWTTDTSLRFETVLLQTEKY